MVIGLFMYTFQVCAFDLNFIGTDILLEYCLLIVHDKETLDTLGKDLNTEMKWNDKDVHSMDEYHISLNICQPIKYYQIKPFIDDLKKNDPILEI